MEIRDNVILFESDEEFTDFCVAPYAQVITDEKGNREGYKSDYSEMYKKYLEQGMIFKIKDEDSVVYKRQCVTKGCQ